MINKRYEHVDNDQWMVHQLKVIKRALWFANCLEDCFRPKSSWPVKVCKRLCVLPPGSRYTINPNGHVQAVLEKKPTAKLIRKYKAQLVAVLETILEGESPTAGQWSWTEGSRRSVNFSRVPEVWVRYVVVGTEILQANAPVITPTLHEFVTYVGSVMSGTPWRNRLAKCAIEPCERYFLAPTRMGGPRPKTCSEQCAKKRSDAKNNERQKRFRKNRQKRT